MSFIQIPIGTYPNTFLGYQSSISLTVGTGNTAFGFRTLNSGQNVFGNTAIGMQSLEKLITGANNTAIGQYSLQSVINAGFNTAVGQQSLILCTEAYNTAIGYSSGSEITTGFRNTILGSYTGNQGGLDIRTAAGYVVLSDGYGNPRLWINNTGAVNIPGGLALTGSLSITGGTVTANNPVLSATQTWNNAAVTFTGWQLNVTDTASNAASLLMNLQVGGSSRFYVDKSGTIANGLALGSIQINPGGTNSIVLRGAGVDWGLEVYSNVSVNVRSTVPLGWATATYSNPDLQLWRDAANTLAQRNGVNAQTFRLYNTYTDASNYERGGLSWSSNELVFFTGNAGTGLARNISIVSAAGINVSAPTSQIGFSTNGLSRWNVANAGHLLAASDNTVDIGASGANRPRNLFIGGSATIGGDATVSGGSGLAVTSGPAVLVGSNARVELVEVTAPAAPAANRVRIYAEDNGSGKTRLMALFATGAAQQIAIEP